MCGEKGVRRLAGLVSHNGRLQAHAHACLTASEVLLCPCLVPSGKGGARSVALHLLRPADDCGSPFTRMLTCVCHPPDPIPRLAHAPCRRLSLRRCTCRPARLMHAPGQLRIASLTCGLVEWGVGQSPRQQDNLRSRWAAVSSRCRESLSKTTRELKGRWGGSTHRGGGEGDTMQAFTPHQPPDGPAGQPSSSNGTLSS